MLEAGLDENRDVPCSLFIRINLISRLALAGHIYIRRGAGGVVEYNGTGLATRRSARYSLWYQAAAPKCVVVGVRFGIEIARLAEKPVHHCHQNIGISDKESRGGLLRG